MTGQKIAIIANAVLLRKGLKSLLSSYLDSMLLEEFRSVSDFLSNYTSNQFAVIFLEKKLYKEISSDEQILKQLSDLILIGIFPQADKEPIPSYFQDSITCSINDEEMVLKLDQWKSDWLDERLLENSDRELSRREVNVLKQVALGKTNKEIADELFLSPHTVITHRKNITRKLGIYTVSGLTVYALINNLINPSEVNK